MLTDRRLRHEAINHQQGRLCADEANIPHSIWLYRMCVYRLLLILYLYARAVALILGCFSLTCCNEHTYTWIVDQASKVSHGGKCGLLRSALCCRHEHTWVICVFGSCYVPKSCSRVGQPSTIVVCAVTHRRHGMLMHGEAF